MNRHDRSDKPDWVPPRSVKLLDQVRERVRYLHYSPQTEKANIYRAEACREWTAFTGQTAPGTPPESKRISRSFAINTIANNDHLTWT